MASFHVRADNNDKLKVFLTSCAYGTAAGALIGVASLAFASDPTQSINNVARGASLGLYAGIGLGFYLANENSIKKQDIGGAVLTPQWYQGKIEGGQVHFFALQF